MNLIKSVLDLKINMWLVAIMMEKFLDGISNKEILKKLLQQIKVELWYAVSIMKFQATCLVEILEVIYLFGND